MRSLYSLFILTDTKILCQTKIKNGTKNLTVADCRFRPYGRRKFGCSKTVKPTVVLCSWIELNWSAFESDNKIIFQEIPSFLLHPWKAFWHKWTTSKHGSLWNTLQRFNASHANSRLAFDIVLHESRSVFLRRGTLKWLGSGRKMEVLEAIFHAILSASFRVKPFFRPHLFLASGEPQPISESVSMGRKP